MAHQRGAVPGVRLLRRQARGVRQRDDGVAVLPGVEVELLACQLPRVPALVERVLQHVDAPAGVVEKIKNVHRCSPWFGCREVRIVRPTPAGTRSRRGAPDRRAGGPSPAAPRGPRSTRTSGATLCATMADTGKIAKNLERFAQAVAAHDRENPTHTAHGIGLAHFDLERLGFEEGEEILPGITIHADSGVTGNFRVLCDGQHDEELTEAEERAVEAIATRSLPAASPALPYAPARPFEQ
jgi:hypothetical protein